ncbi:MAG: modulated efflux pump with fused ATPase and integral rane subunit [Gemmatimonadetes bacterium]|nr:modulated efflux pump with fused ATPase and integral rane subunit [Gemmatimonadota bacterium]
MPLLRSGADRCVLRKGTNTLGGRGVDAVPVAALAFQPAVATITVPSDGAVVIQRSTASVVVRVDDQPLGVGPAELRHGAHIDFSGCRLTYEADGAIPASSAPDVTVMGDITAVRERSARPNGSEPRPARLVDLKTGKAFPLTSRKVVVGRDDGCDLVLLGQGVSRRHASIAPVPGGYLLTDESSNGTLVNNERIGRTHVLEHGDVLMLSDEELRFEIDGSPAPGTATAESSSRAATAVLDLSRLRELPAREARAVVRSAPTASLEIIRCPFTGASFHIARPVCAIGRGEHSDVRLRDDSVSTTHATLLRKGDTWYVVDLRSANGTYVDGYRVAGERELRTGATLRIGTVDMMFRSLSAGEAEVSPRQKGGGVIGSLVRWMRKSADRAWNS